MNLQLSVPCRSLIVDTSSAHDAAEARVLMTHRPSCITTMLHWYDTYAPDVGAMRCHVMNAIDSCVVAARQYEEKYGMLIAVRCTRLNIYQWLIRSGIGAGPFEWTELCSYKGLRQVLSCATTIQDILQDELCKPTVKLASYEEARKVLYELLVCFI